MKLTLTIFSSTVYTWVPFFTYGSVLDKALIYIYLNILHHDDQNLYGWFIFHIYFILKVEMLFAGLDLSTNNDIWKVLSKEANYMHDHFLILTTTPCRCYYSFYFTEKIIGNKCHTTPKFSSSYCYYSVLTSRDIV